VPISLSPTERQTRFLLPFFGQTASNFYRRGAKPSWASTAPASCAFFSFSAWKNCDRFSEAVVVGRILSLLMATDLYSFPFFFEGIDKFQSRPGIVKSTYMNFSLLLSLQQWFY